MVIAPLLAMATLGAAANGVSIPDIVEVTDLTGLSISPDGRLVAFRTERASIGSNGYRMEWYVAPVDGSGPARPVGDGGAAQFTDAGMVAPQQPVWAPSSSTIYYRALVGGEVEVWRAAANGSGAVRMTQDAANVRDLRLSDDRTALTYQVGATRAEIEDAERRVEDDGVLIDKTVDAAMPLSRGSFIDGKPASTRFTGNWFARAGLLSDHALRSVRIALPPGDSSGAEQPRPTSPGTMIIDRYASPWALRVKRPDGTEIPCRTPECTGGRIVSATPLGDGRSLLVTTADIDQRQTLSVWEPGSGRSRPLVRYDGILNGDRANTSIPCATRSAMIICVAAEPAGPPRLVRVDSRTGAIRTLFDPNGGLRRRIDVTVHQLTWKDSQGRIFGGQLLLPSSPRPASGYPLVINYYFCAGFLRGGEGDEQPMIPLAEKGIASLCIEQARRPSRTTPRDWESETALGGVTAITDQLVRDGIVDRKRIGMSGLSFGSEITMTIIQHTDLLRAASISSTQIEPYYYWVNTLPGRDVASVLRDTLHIDDPDSDIAGWKSFAPVRDLAHIRTPLLMQMPENEMRLSMELYSKLANSPTPAEMIGYANETHVKHQPRHKLAVYERNLDWFRFWLKGEEDPDPAKAEQYGRWRSFSARPGFARPSVDRAGP